MSDKKDLIIIQMAEMLMNYTGSCPADMELEGYEKIIDCEKLCDNGCQAKCFILYFTKKECLK